MKAENSKQISHETSSTPKLTIQCEILEKRSSNYSPPRPRFKHQCFIFNQTIYLYGGSFIQSSSDHKENPLDLYSFFLYKNNFKWEKNKLKCLSKEPELMSGHCGVGLDHIFYLFGGINQDYKCNNNLWTINAKSMEI